MNYINRRQFLHFNVLKFSNITEKPVKTSNLYKNEYKSKSYPFKYTTIIKDDTNVVSLHLQTEWFDPISKSNKIDDLTKIYFLDEEDTL